MSPVKVFLDTWRQTMTLHLVLTPTFLLSFFFKQVKIHWTNTFIIFSLYCVMAIWRGWLLLWVASCIKFIRGIWRFVEFFQLYMYIYTKTVVYQSIYIYIYIYVPLTICLYHSVLCFLILSIYLSIYLCAYCSFSLKMIKTRYFKILERYTRINIAHSAGAVEHTDCISAEG